MRIRIRTKLAAALAVPLIALVAVAGQEVKRADDRADQVQQEAELATAAAGPASVISRLQDERNFSLIALLGMTGTLQLPVTSYEQARGATDEAYAELQAFVAERGGEVEAAFARTLEAMDESLVAIRAQVDAYDGPQDLSIETVSFAEGIYAGFAEFITIIATDTSGIAIDIDDADLRTGVELISMTTIDLENSAEISRSIFYQVLMGGSLEETRLTVAGHLNDFVSNRARILARSTGPYTGMPEEWLNTDKDWRQQNLYTQFVVEGVADIAELSEALGSTEVPRMVGLRSEVSDAMQLHADGLVDDAQQRRNFVAALAAGAVGIALIATVFASFSITRPLRSLTRQAEAMATRHLPRAVQQVLDTPLGEDVEVPHVSPVAVRTRDEVADVAGALNTVQRSALDLAVEQAMLRKNIADSFVNLGRRNQELLDRQLDLITDLERRATDPDRLEGLFRLDHLATRMRRNAESLLRLAGGDEELRTGWGAPVPIGDVIRGALGEVEGYQRVEVQALDPAIVDGSAGADIAHAIAELVENALTFSPPHEQVAIRGRRHGTGYVVAITDQGVGMTAEQLEVANRRLAGKESFTVAPSRYLGHYVAGHLASTHGVTVTLDQQTLGGITARFDIPASILIDDRATPTGPAPVEPVEAFEEPVVAPEPVEAVEWVDAVEWAEADEPVEAFEEPVDEPEPVEAVEAVEAFEEPAEAPLDEPDEPGPVEWADADEPGPAPEPEPVAVHEPVAMPSEPDHDRDDLLETLEPVGAGAPTAAFSGAEVTGLTRRIRGANLPQKTNVAAAFGGGTNGAEADRGPATADDVSSFLAAFDSGVSRGLSDATQNDGFETS